MLINGLATVLLAGIGGLASMVAGVGGHFFADHQTKSKVGRTRIAGKRRPAGAKMQKAISKNRLGLRNITGSYGASLKAHFDSQNRIAK
jgi:hypothetical protein